MYAIFNSESYLPGGSPVGQATWALGKFQEWSDMEIVFSKEAPKLAAAAQKSSGLVRGRRPAVARVGAAPARRVGHRVVGEPLAPAGPAPRLRVEALPAFVTGPARPSSGFGSCTGPRPWARWRWCAWTSAAFRVRPRCPTPGNGGASPGRVAGRARQRRPLGAGLLAGRRGGPAPARLPAGGRAHGRPVRAGRRRICRNPGPPRSSCASATPPGPPAA